MKNFITCAVLFLAAQSWQACRDTPDTFELPTKICVTTSHHGYPIPQATVYVKFNADSFPGYDKPAGYFDTQFKTGPDARGCLAAVPEGRHWLVAIGYDSIHFPHDVFGSLPVTISLSGRAEIDTMLYVSEEH